MNRSMTVLLGLLPLLAAPGEASAEIDRDGESPGRRAVLFFSHDRLVHRSHLLAPERQESTARRLWQRAQRKVLPQRSPGHELTLAIPKEDAVRLFRVRSGFHLAVIQPSGAIGRDVLTGFVLRGESEERPLMYFTTGKPWPEGSFYALSPSEEDLRRAVAGLRRGLFALDRILTHRFTLANVTEGFELARTAEDGYVKGLLLPNGSDQ